MPHEDLYGNPEQNETVTTVLLATRKNRKLESDGLFRLGLKIYPDMTRDALVLWLRKAAEIVEATNAERFHVEFLIEQVTEK